MIVACLEPGLAWMVMATEEGGTKRIHPGNFFEQVVGVIAAAAGDDDDDDLVVVVVELAFALPFFVGAISPA